MSFSWGFVVNMKYRIVAILFIVIALINVLITGCNKKDVESLFADEDEQFTAGVNGTVADETSNAFGNPVPRLTNSESDQFIVGNSFNRNSWVTAPSSTTGRDGLGPLFNATACASCHILDGRGKPPAAGESISSIIFRLSMPGDVEIPNYGKQLQNRAINGVLPEGSVNITYTEIPGTYPDGTTYSLRKPHYQFVDLKYGDFPAGFLFSPRVAPKMAGAGNFDAVTDATLLAMADPLDADGDGISGKVNYVFDNIKNKTVIGRHGWKSNTASIPEQVADAFINDIGITSIVFPDQQLSGTQIDMYKDLPNGGSPELETRFYNDVVFYTSALAMPERRKTFNEQSVLEGKKIFKTIGCGKCHAPELKTGTHEIVSQLSNQTIRPYSDLLLHDMGEGLADNRPDHDATGNEWRTTPLWGISYYQTVNKHTFLLHDGRARNIEEAILWHGGESEKVINSFKSLSKTERDKVIKFLETL
jgi:CxxC motif-containing protein (DUF1111 family)